MASETQTTGEETRLDATQATGEDTRPHGIQYLDLISNKLTCIEKRQCDASGEGTDAARMVEEWTRGANANITEAARAVLVRRAILARSAQATTYASLFSEKDYVRAEKQVWLFWRGYHKNEKIGHMDSETDVGASFCELPLFRGKECMSSEMMLELAGVPDGEFKKAMKLETYLQPLSLEYMACQELMTPLNKRFEGNDYRVPNVESTAPIRGTALNWREDRHNLRRVSVSEEVENPFREVHEMTDEDLFKLIPDDIKRYLNECENCENVQEPHRCS